MGTPGLSLENQGVRCIERIDREPIIQTVSRIQPIRRWGEGNRIECSSEKVAAFSLTSPPGPGKPPAEGAVTFPTNLSGWVGSMLCSLLLGSYFQ